MAAIEALFRGKHCVNELTELIGSDMATISRHHLRNVGRNPGKDTWTKVKGSLREFAARLFEDSWKQ